MIDSGHLEQLVSQAVRNFAEAVFVADYRNAERFVRIALGRSGGWYHD